MKRQWWLPEGRGPSSSFHDLDTIKISFKPSALQLLHMYKEIHNLIVKHSAALVPHKVRFAQPVGGIPSTFNDQLSDGVPIALPYDDQDLYFFILEVLMDDDAVIQFPMRMDSMYCCGFRCLMPSEDPLEKLCDKIQIYKGVIAKFCSHFRDFQPRWKDPVAQVLKDTVFFMFSEGSRFWFAMALSFQGIQNKNSKPVRLSGLMGELIQNYGDSSRLGVYLWLAFLEREMKLSLRCLHDTSRFPDLLLAFGEEAKDFLRYVPLLKFKASDAVNDWSLESFVGQSLFIIKYSCVLVRKAVMRDAGYDRIFPVMMPISVEDVNCYDD